VSNDAASFWRAGPGLRETAVDLRPAANPGVTPGRLGPPPGAHNPEKTSAWLAGCYAAVRRGAASLAAGEGLNASVKAARGRSTRRR
jgi:hypothetical protein